MKRLATLCALFICIGCSSSGKSDVGLGGSRPPPPPPDSAQPALPPSK